MSRKTTRVEIPRNADELIVLLREVLEKNAELGDDSPLKSLPMDVMQDRTGVAAQAQEKAKELERLAKIETSKRDNAFGTVQIEGGALYILTQVRDLLLTIHKANPAMLGEWGFDVIEGEAVTHRKPEDKAAKEPKKTAILS